MNNNYDDEATRYEGAENEDTQFENDTLTTNEATELLTSEEEVKVEAVKKSGWKRVATGAGAGLLVGGVTTMLMGMKGADSDSTVGDNHKDELTNPEWVDDEISVATTVNDDMTFGEAFVAAREEVGPGGCFEWHGNVYGTYTADEWNSMSAEQRAEFGDHFSWNHIDHSQSNVAHHSTTVHDSHIAGDHAAPTADDDIEVVSVNHEGDQNNMAQHTAYTGQPNGQNEVVDVTHVEGPTGDTEIEILGVAHDNDSGANVGGMMVDNNEVIFIDVDGDLTFDYMASDLNHNGQVDQNEVAEIHDQNITVDDLGGFSHPTVDMHGYDDTPDYSSDIYES